MIQFFAFSGVSIYQKLILAYAVSVKVFLKLEINPVSQDGSLNGFFNIDTISNGKMQVFSAPDCKKPGNRSVYRGKEWMMGGHGSCHTAESIKKISINHFQIF